MTQFNSNMIESTYKKLDMALRLIFVFSCPQDLEQQVAKQMGKIEKTVAGFDPIQVKPK